MVRKNLLTLTSVLMCFPAAGFVCLPVGAAPFTLSQTFDDPTPGASDGFGIAVSVSGNNVLIGVRNDGVNGNGNGIGQAHLYLSLIHI